MGGLVSLFLFEVAKRGSVWKFDIVKVSGKWYLGISSLIHIGKLRTNTQCRKKQGS